jgi:hypothetical protein
MLTALGSGLVELTVVVVLAEEEVCWHWLVEHCDQYGRDAVVEEGVVDPHVIHEQLREGACGDEGEPELAEGRKHHLVDGEIRQAEVE